MCIGQGDPLCISAIVDSTPGRPQQRQLLMPAAMRGGFPSCTSEGMVGCSMQQYIDTQFAKIDPKLFLKNIRDATLEYVKIISVSPSTTLPAK